MSTDLAQYVGYSGTGVDLAVPLTDGQIVPLHVEPHGTIPAQLRGVDIDSDYVENLLSQDAWIEPVEGVDKLKKQDLVKLAAAAGVENPDDLTVTDLRAALRAGAVADVPESDVAQQPAPSNAEKE